MMVTRTRVMAEEEKVADMKTFLVAYLIIVLNLVDLLIFWLWAKFFANTNT